jgi:hypothetical protein
MAVAITVLVQLSCLRQGIASPLTARAPGIATNGIVNPMAAPYNAKCDGASDDTAAFSSAIGNGRRVVEIPAGATCDVDHLVIPAQTVLRGASDASSTLRITGTGGGVCDLGAGGGLQLSSGGAGRDTIADLTIEATNPALDCLINVSPKRFDVPNVSLRSLWLTTSGIPPARQNPIALYTNNVIDMRLDTINVSGTFRQQWLALGDLNGVTATALELHANSSNLLAGVYNDSNPMVRLERPQGIFLAGWVCEQGPTCLAIGPGGSSVEFAGAWSGDGIYRCTPWLPSTSYSAGACVIPSTVRTVSTTAGSTSIRAMGVPSLTPGRWVYIPGAGSTSLLRRFTGHAMYNGLIKAVAGSTLTMNSPPAVSIRDAVLAAENYTGHIYVTPKGGTSGGAGPRFPTTHNATVADGSIAWVEYGTGSMFRIGTPGASFSGNMISGIAGVSLYADATAQGVDVKGNRFYEPTVAAVYSEGATGLQLGGNYLYGGTAPLLTLHKYVGAPSGITVTGNTSSYGIAPILGSMAKDHLVEQPFVR